MDTNIKDLNTKESIVLYIAIFLFAFLSFLVVFQRDWLDSIIYGPANGDEYLEEIFVDDSDLMDIPDYYVSLDVIPQEDGQALVYLNAQEGNNPEIVGIELFLEKEVSLDIEDFVCSENFECLLFEVDGDEIYLAATVPENLLGTMSEESLFVGTIYYSGSGNVYNSTQGESFVSDLDVPEENILEIDSVNFYLD